MRRWRGSVALAVVLVLALVGAPLARTVRAAGCRTCPPHCPMHRKGKLPCHQAPGTHAGGGCGNQGPGIGPPGCGANPEPAGSALPPVILPPPVVAWSGPVARPLRALDAAMCVRGADPPDTPPPIAVS